MVRPDQPTLRSHHRDGHKTVQKWNGFRACNGSALGSLDDDALDLVEADLITPAIIKLGGAC